MKKRMLAVRPKSKNYVDYFDVTSVGSFAEAERMMRIIGYDALDLPAENETALQSFLKRLRPGTVSIAVHGVDDVGQFIKIRDMVRDMGFEFLD